MYGRRAVFTLNNPADPDPATKLRNFGSALYSNDYYDIIIDNLFTSPGFIEKNQLYIERKDFFAIIGWVVFDSKESFDNYAKDPATMSIVDAMKAYAQADGISIEFTDSDQVYISNL